MNTTTMISNTFSADAAVVIYAGCSVALCVLIYKAKDFARFDWRAEAMNRRLGAGRIYQVDPNSGDAARNAAVAATNVTDSMTPANGASLLVLAFFLFGAFAGSVAIPAALGMMSSITTLNLLGLMTAGLAWGLGLGRLTMSLTIWIIKLAVWSALIVAALYAVNFAGSFLNNGNDLFWDAAASQVNAVKDTLYNYDRAPAGSWFFNYEQHRKHNLCAVYEGIRTKGDIRAVRSECN